MKKFIVASAALVIAMSASQAFADNVRVRANSNSSSESYSNANANNRNSVNVSNRKQVAAVAAPGLAASGISCQGSASVGIGTTGFGLSMGSTVMDRDCNHRENVRVANQIFGRTAAVQIACKISDFQDLPQCAVYNGSTRVSTRNMRPSVSNAGYPVTGKSRVVADWMTESNRR